MMERLRGTIEKHFSNVNKLRLLKPVIKKQNLLSGKFLHLCYSGSMLKQLRILALERLNSDKVVYYFSV